ncbi:ATP-binding protein [Stieleria varia]|uniref:histidine kinase n=1 Tax=Stieleria varia TaxID=2528005 RepID=A0A5C6B4U7_9BACT|nr:ATP-binding protein [Stieleria varia]TWU06306.1 Sensor protein ZraS [Stieleria varia]
MSSITDYTRTFGKVAAQTLLDMFGVPTDVLSDVEETVSVETSRSFIVSLYYTGTVYGEYLLAMDEETAARIIEIDEPITDENRHEVRDQICDALSETLNTIVGEAIVHVQESYPKLTLTAPRVFFGQIRYPHFKTGRAFLETAAGTIECHFCLDLMRLDLATSYEEAVQTLVTVNSQLKEANRHLAEQQAQLVLTEKMASVGILASGVAHEINNPLFFVDANIATMGDYLTAIDSMLVLYEKLCDSLQANGSDWINELDTIRKESEVQDIAFVMEDTKTLMTETREGIDRIKTIVQSLKDFSQAERAGMAEADVNVIASNTCRLIACELPPACRFEQNLSELPKLICNAAEIGQVLSSVIINAVQAIGDEGQVTLNSESTDSDIVLTVTDTGEGISDEHIDHVFEPFYSTKTEGQGSGLGLSIAYGIIKKHNGSITISSKPEQGTKVTITIPVANQLSSV